MNFKRGVDPKKALNIGIEGKVLKVDNITNSSNFREIKILSKKSAEKVLNNFEIFSHIMGVQIIKSDKSQQYYSFSYLIQRNEVWEYVLWNNNLYKIPKDDV